jgi:nicotinamide mononucleotide adenylyltransferase
MKNLPTFEEFVLFENANRQRVCVFPGRFQPFHLGHITALRETSMRFQCPVIPVQIKSKNEESPFPDSLLQKIGDSIAKEFEFIETYVLYPQNLKTVIPQMVKILQEKGYNPVGVGCGSDRQKDYERQVAYLTSEKSDVQVEEFRVEMVDPRQPGGPSGTKVREAILSDDEKLFKQLTPNSIHKYYKEMKKFL